MLIKRRTMRVDYFTVEARGAGSFSDVLRKIANMPNNSRRNRTLSSYPVRLDICNESHSHDDVLFEGDIIKIRMENLPIKAGTDGSKEDLDFNSDEGVGEETAFLYSEKHATLAMQSNRIGITPTLFESYFSHFGDSGDSFELCPIVSRDTMERLTHAAALRSITMRVSPKSGAEYLNQCGVSVKNAVGSMNELGGHKVEITVSVEGQGKTLYRDRVVKTIKNLIRHNDENGGINKLQTTADLDEEGIQPIDFLNDRVRFKDEVEYDANRRMSYDVRNKLVRRAWNYKAFQNLLR